MAALGVRPGDRAFAIADHVTGAAFKALFVVEQDAAVAGGYKHLGIIEGVTEFLPVSSTGHLLLAEHWANLPSQPSDLFNVVIQSGAVLAVVLVFAGRIRQMLRDRHTPVVRDYVAKLALAFILTAIGGLAMKKLGLRLPETAAPVAWATLIGGIVILVVERMVKGQTGAGLVTWPVAILVGLSQLVAASFPGTSRSGITIIVALLLGLSRPAATEFSFLLGVPTLLAAAAFNHGTYCDRARAGGSNRPESG